jgi:hypothetical protein
VQEKKPRLLGSTEISLVPRSEDTKRLYLRRNTRGDRSFLTCYRGNTSLPSMSLHRGKHTPYHTRFGMRDYSSGVPKITVNKEQRMDITGHRQYSLRS